LICGDKWNAQARCAAWEKNGPPQKADLQSTNAACENGEVNPFLISVPAAVIATAGVAAYGAIYPRSQIFGPTICRTNSPQKLAITFDDGPNPAITPKLLDLLDRYEVKATFFLIGRFVRECPDLVKETVVRGHVVGNHTDTHPNLFWLTPTQITAELRFCHDAISGVLGAPPKWFRPPYGFRNPWVVSEAHKLGCQTVMWTLIPGDWREKSAEWLIERMTPIAAHAQRRSYGEKQIPRANTALGMTSKSSEGAAGGTGDVLCLHDGGHRGLNADRTRTLAALKHWLSRWRDLGLDFVTMDQAVPANAA
jgi:peptidoglycan-N-acetylglucosamine deacetylase